MASGGSFCSGQCLTPKERVGDVAGRADRWRLRALAGLSLTLLLTLVIMMSPPAGVAEECVQVRTGESMDCAEAGAVTKEVYEESTLRDNPDLPTAPSAEGSDSVSGAWIVALIIVLLIGLTALSIFMFRRQSSNRKPPGLRRDAAQRGEEPPVDSGQDAESAFETDGPGRSSRYGEWIAGHPAWAVGAAFLLGVVIAGGIGILVISAKNSDIQDLQADLSAEQAARSTAESERDQAQARADRVTERRDQIISSAKSKAQGMIDDAKSELSDLEDKIQSAQSDLSATEAKLADVQASLDVAQEQKNMSSFGDGTWQANVDYLPGTYSAPGGSGCYWEKLNGPSGGGINNIIDNGGFNKNQIVSIDSPYFSTDGCGTWTRTGE